MQKNDTALNGKLILVTGAARRVGRMLALAAARAGADVIVYYGKSKAEADDTKKEISSIGRKAWTIPADLSQADEVADLIPQASKIGTLYALINSAAIFESLTMQETKLPDWERHLAINLTAPFILSQAFARQLGSEHGRIVNILDWRALRPGADHFPYTISKAALAAMTKSLAVSLAPNISVNGLALGAILPPSDHPVSEDFLKSIPAGRWSKLEELEEALIFLLTGPSYITGEIIHVDGGRHLI
jgi:NAD(P)-dependent dehydrogenase (short-subunit alcohol dehydrogenase family)